MPDIIVSSNANRARTTAEAVAQSLNNPAIEVELVEDLYLAPPDVYVECLKRLADQFRRPMLVGHNPGIESLVYQLSGQMHGMPTAAVACFSVEVDSWSEFDEQAAGVTLEHVWRPKEI